MRKRTTARTSASSHWGTTIITSVRMVFIWCQRGVILVVVWDQFCGIVVSMRWDDMTKFVYHIHAKTNDGKDVSVISLG